MPFKAYITKLYGIESFVLAKTKGQAASTTIRSARDAGYTPKFTEIRVTRWREADMLCVQPNKCISLSDAQSLIEPCGVINLNPRESQCIVCGCMIQDCRQGIPMHEGAPVPFDYDKEWGGFDACKICFDAYESVAHDPHKLEAWWAQVCSEQFTQ